MTGETRGYFIGTNGGIAQTAGTYAYSAPISVSKGKTYAFTGTGSTIMSALCTCDANGDSRESVSVYAATDTEETFEYTPSADGYIVLSYNYSHAYSLVARDVVETIKYYADKLDTLVLADEFDAVTEKKENLYDVDDVEIGKNWIGGTAADRASISIPVTGGETYTVVIPANANIPDVAVVRVKASTASLGSQDITGGNSASITMESNCVEIRIQFQGSTTLASTDFENYDVYVFEGTVDVETAIDSTARSTVSALGQRIDDISEEIGDISEYRTNIAVNDSIVIGIDWTGNTNTKRAAITVDVLPSTQYTIIVPTNSNVQQVLCIQKSSRGSNSAIANTVLDVGKNTLTTESTTYCLFIQFANYSTDFTSDMFNGYTPVVILGARALTAMDDVARSSIIDADTALGERIDDISEDAANLASGETIEIGKNWLGGTDAQRARMFVNVLPSTQYTIVLPANSYIQQIDCRQKASRGATTFLSTTTLSAGTNTLTTESTTYYLLLQFANFSVDFTEEMFSGYTPFVCAGTEVVTARDDVARRMNQWEGKKLVWLGTSIPAAGKYNVSNPISYPIMVGNMLGATVYNEAVGSSALHCKDPSRISAANPYGFFSNFEAVSRCITNSIDEMNWIIEHYNDSAVFTQNVPNSLSDDDKAFIRSCSWETKIGQYLTSSTFPDAWIIDHGHNDLPTATSEAYYTAKTVMSGTQHDGYYTGGRFVSSTASSYIEYDVSALTKVWISGTFGSYYDVYDLYDGDGNNLRFKQNSASETTVDALEINVMDATTLRISNINTKISTVAAQKLAYPIYENVYCYQGAFDFVINKILSYNPHARIIMIGEYENQKYPTISENQIIASERWEFPLYRQWENLGFSQQPILVDGEYKPMLKILIPDNLHPHTDTTGWVLKTMARNIYGWLLTLG